jgi:putative transcriptional regulator
MEKMRKRISPKKIKRSLRDCSKKLKTSKSMSTFSEKVKHGLEEILEYKQGKRTLRTKLIDLPEPPMEYRAAEIKKIREKGEYSQSVFASVLNVSVRTVQSWESGERVPSHAALRLLEIIDKGIYRPKLTQKSA